MRALHTFLLVLTVACCARASEVESTKDSLRVFLLPTPKDYRPRDTDFPGAKVWAAHDVHDFLLFHLRDGSEFGRQVPALWVHRKGAAYCLAIVDEEARFEAEFRSARVDADDTLVFELFDGRSSRTVKMRLMWRPQFGLIFVERRGVEFLGK